MKQSDMKRKSENIKIALVNPRIEMYSSTLPPLGLLYIAAVLEKSGHKVRIFDIYPYDDRDITSLINYNPDIVGLTALTDYWSRAQHIARAIREKISDCTFIAGGVHITVKPEDSLKGLDADIGVIGEGEYTMLELCDRLANGSDWRGTNGIIYRDQKGKFIRTEPRMLIEDLNELPFPARHLLNFEDYLVPPGIIRGHWSEHSTTLMTSRGCPYKCIWCGSQSTFGRKVRRRSVENVIDELKQIIRDHGVDTVWFVDDTFTLNKRWVLEFSEQLLANKIKLSWGCQAHVNTADEEMFQAMKKAGLIQLDFGVESGSDKVLKALKKRSSRDAAKRAFKIVRKVGLRAMATFMFGSPTETEDDVEATMSLAREIRPSFASSFFITPYPGTELMQMAEDNNWISSDDKIGAGLKKRPMLKIHFSEKELYKIRTRFQSMFIYRNFFSLLFNPRYVVKAFSLFAGYPIGIILGLRKFLKTFVVDDFFFEFLIYYVRERSKRKKAAIAHSVELK